MIYTHINGKLRYSLVACVSVGALAFACASADETAMQGGSLGESTSIGVAKAAVGATSTATGTGTGISPQMAVSLSSNGDFDAVPRTFTVIQWQTVLYDVLNNYDPTHGTVIVPGDGDYQVCASLASFSTDFELDIFINGIRENAIAESGHGNGQGCRTVRLKANDGIQVEVYHENASNIHFSGNTFWNWMTVDKVISFASLDDSDPFNVPNQSFTQVPYNSPLYNDYGGYVVQQHSFRAPLNVVYEICASAAGFYEDFEMDLFSNGVRAQAFAVSKHGMGHGCVQTSLNLATSDIRIFQNRVSSMSFAHNSFWNWMTVDEVMAVVASSDNVSAFTAPSGTFVPVLYSTGSKVTTGVKGEYQVCASLASFSQDFELDLFINGNREKAIAGSNFGIGTGCRTVRMEKSDTLQVQVYQNSGSTVTFQPNTNWAWMRVNQRASRQ